MAKRVTEAHPDYIKRLLELSEESEAETNQAQMQRLKRALRDVIKNDLTPRQKEMVVLYYYEGMRMPQIAQQLNRDVSTVSRTIKRARRNLRDILLKLTADIIQLCLQGRRDFIVPVIQEHGQQR